MLQERLALLRAECAQEGADGVIRLGRLGRLPLRLGNSLPVRELRGHGVPDGGGGPARR